MGIYLPNMEMPKDYAVVVKIFPDGRVGTIPYIQFFKVDLIEEAQAVPVPPHGDLIDRAELKRKSMYSNRFDDDEQFVYLDDIDAAPTIIPASEEGK